MGQNFFSLQSLLKLYRQLHNRPELPFKTVGEVICFRDALIESENKDRHESWTVNKRRALFIEHLASEGDASYLESKSFIESRMADTKDACEIRSSRRMADIRAVQTFLERCGLSV